MSLSIDEICLFTTTPWLLWHSGYGDLCLLVWFICDIRGFWTRHRRKVFVTTGVLGGGYLLYKLYNAHRQRLADLEAELAREQESSDELLKAKLIKIPISFSCSHLLIGYLLLATCYLVSNVMSFYS